MPSPITVALGGEYRKNIYEIGSGDPGSIFKEGGQSDAGKHKRHNTAVYLNVAAEPIEHLKIDDAVRYEHCSDFGSTTTYKATGRYDFSPAVALRGTISTGFRARTLAESFYSASVGAPTSAFVQLPANSAAAKLLGFPNLKPEKSVNYSLGFVFRPAPRLPMTIDAFQVRNRILGTGSIFGSAGTVNWMLSGTYNKTKATRIYAAPVQLVPGTTNFTLVNGGKVLDTPLTFSPYGINGGYYYGRIAVKF